MSNIQNLFKEILNEFGTNREMVSVSYKLQFDDYLDCIRQIEQYYQEHRTEVLEERFKNEDHFHNFLKHQLFTRLQEIKYYSDVNITDTRRLVAVSSDCISMIQILVRDDIHVNVYFRSSDFDGALPVDLMFISRLPYDLITHLCNKEKVKGYEEVNPGLIYSLSLMNVKLNLYFGSLHRTV